MKESLILHIIFISSEVFMLWHHGKHKAHFWQAVCWWSEKQYLEGCNSCFKFILFVNSINQLFCFVCSHHFWLSFFPTLMEIFQNE